MSRRQQCCCPPMALTEGLTSGLRTVEDAACFRRNGSSQRNGAEPRVSSKAGGQQATAKKNHPKQQQNSTRAAEPNQRFHKRLLNHYLAHKHLWNPLATVCPTGWARHELTVEGCKLLDWKTGSFLQNRPRGLQESTACFHSEQLQSVAPRPLFPQDQPSVTLPPPQTNRAAAPVSAPTVAVSGGKE